MTIPQNLDSLRAKTPKDAEMKLKKPITISAITVPRKNLSTFPIVDILKLYQISATITPEIAKIIEIIQ